MAFYKSMGYDEINDKKREVSDGIDFISECDKNISQRKIGGEGFQPGNT